MTMTMTMTMRRFLVVILLRSILLIISLILLVFMLTPVDNSIQLEVEGMDDGTFFGVLLNGNRPYECAEKQTYDGLCNTVHGRDGETHNFSEEELEGKDVCDTFKELEDHIKGQIKFQSELGCPQVFVCLNACDNAKPSQAEGDERVSIRIVGDGDNDNEGLQYIIGCNPLLPACTFTTDFDTNGLPLFTFSYGLPLISKTNPEDITCRRRSSNGNRDGGRGRRPSLFVFNIRFDGNNNVVNNKDFIAPVPGGLVRIDGFHTVAVTNCQFVNAKPGAYIGSGLAITAATIANVTSTVFIDCGTDEGTGFGGGLFINNDKGGGEDGGSLLLFDDVANLDRVSLTRCASSDFGGGAFVSASNVNTLTVNFAQDCKSNTGAGMFADAYITNSDRWRCGSCIAPADQCGSCFSTYMGRTLVFKSLHTNNELPSIINPDFSPPICVKAKTKPGNKLEELIVALNNNSSNNGNNNGDGSVIVIDPSTTDNFSLLPIKDAQFIDFKSSIGYSPVSNPNLKFSRMKIQDSFWCADDTDCPTPSVIRSTVIGDDY
jgi:molybdopterin converting factor small subunit